MLGGRGTAISLSFILSQDARLAEHQKKLARAVLARPSAGRIRSASIPHAEPALGKMADEGRQSQSTLRQPCEIVYG